MNDRERIDTAPTRRRLILMGLAGAATLAAGPVLAALPRAGARSLAFHHLHTGEAARLTYWTDGSYVPDTLDRLNRLLRDFRTGDQMAIDPRLFDVLHALQIRLDTDAPFHVISGYRSPRTNEMLRRSGGGVSGRSLHMVGMAIDVRLPGRRLAEVYREARALEAGGAGYYPKSDFVHLDTGRVRFW